MCFLGCVTARPIVYGTSEKDFGFSNDGKTVWMTKDFLDNVLQVKIKAIKK